jgi:hypothetical protein
MADMSGFLGSHAGDAAADAYVNARGWPVRSAGRTYQDTTTGKRKEDNGSGWIFVQRELTPQSANGVPFTFTAVDNVLSVDMTTGAGDQACNLPNANTCSGRRFTIKKVDAGAGGVVVTPTGCLIDGAATYRFTTQNMSIDARSDGTNYEIA